MSSGNEVADVWLLTGNRAGEVAQQRAVGAALGVRVREVKVAQMAAIGKPVTFDLDILRPPYPRVAISFGKTLVAAVHLRERACGRVRLVHLGLPRRLPVRALDLIVPMPADHYIDAPNVLSIRMPFNQPPVMHPESPAAQRLLASGLPRPWTALLFGGHTTRARLELSYAERLLHTVRERVLQRGGSLLVTTSPRTPDDVMSMLKLQPAIPGMLHIYNGRSVATNPYGAYLSLADELVVTGDSCSMVAECWRTGRPLWVAPLPQPLHRRCARRLRSAVPRSFIASGIVAADIDIDRWLSSLASDGHIGLWDVCDPSRPYSRWVDDDLPRTVQRIRALLQGEAIVHEPVDRLGRSL